jgi:hypothetical protein
MPGELLIMSHPMDYPLLVFAISLLVLLLSARIGVFLREKRERLGENVREDLGTILAATLTLLGLIIGFTFSMAIGRYDQRKNYEEEEANAIGTEYVRANLLPEADAAKVKSLLNLYLSARIDFYRTRDQQTLRRISAQTNQLQEQLWSTVQVPAEAKPTPVIALAVSGMNDVLNSQGYTQAAWWNHIPIEAWALMGLIAVCSNILIGYMTLGAKTEAILLFALPFIVSISFLLIADIDSPRSGLIHVRPQNLVSLSESFRPH